MANRGASAAVQAEWAKSANAPAHLYEIAFDAAEGGSLYRTDSYRDVLWNGNTFRALGDTLGFRGLEESAELRIADLTVEFSGVDQTLISVVLSKQYLGRALRIWKMFFSSAADALIVDPVAIHDGRMEEPSVNEDPDLGKSVVAISSRDNFSDFERLNGRHTNPNDQNLWFPNDRGFDLLPQIAFKNRSFVWGLGSPTSNAGFGNVGTIFT